MEKGIREARERSGFGCRKKKEENTKTIRGRIRLRDDRGRTSPTLEREKATKRSRKQQAKGAGTGKRPFKGLTGEAVHIFRVKRRMKK